MTDTEKLAQIKANWSETDAILYRTPEIKLSSLKEAEKRVKQVKLKANI